MIDTVVFVPGICGSVLKAGEEIIWPGTPENVVFESYPDRFVELLATSSEIRATDVLRNVPLRVLGLTLHHFDGYGRALDALEEMGFRVSGGSLIPWAYDWRLDIRTTAAALHDRLAQADLRGKQIAIVAHSMGGLIARHMLEKIGAPASVQVTLCVLAAVPHLGAPVALQNVLGMRPEIFLTGAQCKVALRNPAFPSGYQLLPHAGVPALRQQSNSLGFVVSDMFSAQTSQKLDLVAGSLQAAREFGAGLPFMGPAFEPPCRYVAIAGNEQETTTANYLEDTVGARAVEEPTAGDGTVPLWSAAPPGIPVRYVASAHGSILADNDAIALLRALLKPGSPGARLFSLDAASGPAVLSAQAVDPSVEAGQFFFIAVVADRPTDTIDAVLEIERSFSETRSEKEEVPIRYSGGLLRSIPMQFKAPGDRAVLKFHVRQQNVQAESKDSTVLVVK